MENNLTAQEEIARLVTTRARELSMNGNPKAGADLVTEYKRSQLADSHPSKNPGSIGSLMGEQISALAAFERDTKKTQDSMAFISAITYGGQSPEAIGKTVAIFIDFFRLEYPNMLGEIAQYMLKSKKEAGFEQAEWPPVVEEPKQIKGS